MESSTERDMIWTDNPNIRGASVNDNNLDIVSYCIRNKLNVFDKWTPTIPFTTKNLEIAKFGVRLLDKYTRYDIVHVSISYENGINVRERYNSTRIDISMDASVDEWKFVIGIYYKLKYPIDDLSTIHVETILDKKTNRSFT